MSDTRGDSVSGLEPSGVQTCDFCNQPTTRPYVGRDEEADVDVVSCAPCAVALGEEAPCLLTDAVSYRESVVLKARYAGQSLDGVAAGLGVSKARVEQIEAQAQAKIVKACLGQIPCKPDDDWTLPTPPSDTRGDSVSGLEPDLGEVTISLTEGEANAFVWAVVFVSDTEMFSDDLETAREKVQKARRNAFGQRRGDHV